MNFNWKAILKSIAAVAVAVLILDLFCAWYYNPTDYLHDDYWATDTIREPGAFTSRAKEGIAWATMDENGYNNAYIPGEDGVSVLIMGSSHAEGLNVLQEENSAWLLNEKLAADGVKGCVYNIGISSHAFFRNSRNLQRALERFRPHDYVVMETSDVVFTPYQVGFGQGQWEGRNAQTVFTIPEWLSDRPLLRTLYRQWTTFIGLEAAVGEGNDGAADLAGYDVPDETYDRYVAALTDWFSYMKGIADEYSVELIVYYHPHLTLNADGTASPRTNEECLQAMREVSEATGVIFLDMTEDFMAAFEADYTVPHGFSNTLMGTGHLNPAGHAMIADALYEIISEREDAQV